MSSDTDSNTINIEKPSSNEINNAENKFINDQSDSISNNDLEILMKMENANREMETNNKSAQSILNKTTTDSPTSLSRRTSLASFEINSLTNDDNSTKNYEEANWELWNQIISDWITWSKRKSSYLKEYIRKGIPVYLRPLAWQYMSGANLTDSKEKYKEYLKKQSAFEKLIRRDIDRTYPDHDLFKNGIGQESLFNIMKAYSIYDPEVGYCQGSAFICGLLLIQNIPEEEAFAIFVQIMQNYHLRDIYKPNMYHLGLCMYQLENCVEEMLPELYSHFIAHGFHTSMYSSAWFLTLFTTTLPLQLVCRIMDVFLNEGFEIIFRVALAVLEFHKENLISLDMEGMLKYFQKEIPLKHEKDHETILNKAFNMKYNSKKMKKLEKDYLAAKKDEHEEQIEIRRLKAENKLLKQRIENLEKESASLAERLIQGQVVNAQNAESIFALKNDNQKLKEKISENDNKLKQIEINNKSAESDFIEYEKITEQKYNEIQLLHEKIKILLDENTRLRENPDTQRLEEELVQVKLRDAESQLAIKELQKTIQSLNIEYQEFITRSNFNKTVKNDTQLQDSAELLKFKMKEAEYTTELKAVNLKLMQMETEIKRQDEDIKKLNASIQKYSEKDVDIKNQLTELKHQLDDKEAKIKELNMTHKLKELEDAHVIAELRQRVAALEVQIEELLTKNQLDDEKSFFTDNEEIKHMALNNQYKLLKHSKSMDSSLMTNSLLNDLNHSKIDHLKSTEYLESDQEIEHDIETLTNNNE